MNVYIKRIDERYYMSYKWEIKHQYDNDLFKAKQQDMGLNIDEFNDFINHIGKIRSPFQLKNMDKLVDRVQTAILNNEKIVICADYDMDGISAASIMMLGLLQLTANVSFSIPDRQKDGYGISKRQIDECVKNDVDLIITVDTGIAEHENIKYAQDNEIDVIVTDHHPWNSDTLPCEITVDPFIDPNYEFPYICGAMVAYKTIRALIPELKKMNKDLNNQLIVLAAMATIADVMKLEDENRIFVYHGLKLINQTKNYGINTLLKLLKLDKKEVTETDIGFSIAPCINAVGRMENAGQLVDMFLADCEIDAEKIAKHAIILNEKRKELTEELMAQVEVGNEPFIVQVFDSVPAGLLGIAANKISHKYQRPCFALTKYSDRYGGSGRSIFGYDISQNIVQNKDLDITGGGHSEACAMSINKKNFDEFKKRCNDNYLQFLATRSQDDSQPILNVDFEINFCDINFNLINQINQFRPFGQGNDEIKFCTKNIIVLSKQVFGRKKNALKFVLSHNNYELPAICFNELKDYYLEQFNKSTCIDMIYTISINEFAGKRNIQLLPIDFKEHEFF